MICEMIATATFSYHMSSHVDRIKRRKKKTKKKERKKILLVMRAFRTYSLCSFPVYGRTSIAGRHHCGVHYIPRVHLSYIWKYTSLDHLPSVPLFLPPQPR